MRSALAKVQSKYGAGHTFGSFDQLSATLPLNMPDAQLPTTLHEDSDVEFHGGLSATFILDFARAIVRQYPMTVDPTQVKVLLLDEAGLENVKCVHLKEVLHRFTCLCWSNNIGLSCCEKLSTRFCVLLISTD